jgi:hypothetical protein
MGRNNVKTHTGNRVVVRFDGKIIGLAQNVRGSDDYALDPASGIGDAHVQEYVPTIARHTVTVGFMALKQKGLAEQGIAPENADEALKGYVFDIELYDKDTNTMLKKYIDCSYNNGDLDVTKHAIIMRNATFMALDVSGKGL